VAIGSDAERNQKVLFCDQVSTQQTRRMFLVAGSAGSGKSTLAKALAHQLDAGWLQLDRSGWR
jgi:adenylylsulfate kinase-like enzyme